MCKIIIMITADFCILPMGIESSEIGEYVAEAVEVIPRWKPRAWKSFTKLFKTLRKQYLKWVLEESTAY